MTKQGYPTGREVPAVAMSGLHPKADVQTGRWPHLAFGKSQPVGPKTKGAGKPPTPHTRSSLNTKSQEDVFVFQIIQVDIGKPDVHGVI